MTRLERGDLNLGGYPLGTALPKGWVILSVGEITEDIRPGFASGEHNKKGEGIPHLRPMNINSEGRIDLSQVRYVDPKTSSLRLRKGDILFNNTNSPVWVGKTALIKEDIEFAFSNHMTRIRVMPQVANSDFVARQLHFLATSGYFQLHCKKHVNQASFASGALEGTVPLLLPPYMEQQRIVHKVNDLQMFTRRAREALEPIPDLLDQLRQSVLAAAFRGDLTKRWREEHPNAEPASELLKRIRLERRKRWEKAELDKLKAKGLTGEKLDSEFAKRRKQYKEPGPVDTSDLPRLPDGWCWAPTETIAECALGKMLDRQKHTKGQRLPYLRNINIRWGQVDTNNLLEMYFKENEIDRYSVRKGDVIVCEGGEPGRAAVWEETDVALYQKALHRVQPFQGILPWWMVYHLRHDAIRGSLSNFFTGTTIKHFTGRSLARYPIAVPPTEEQSEIVEQITSSFAKIERMLRGIKHTLLQLSQFEDAILSKAFHGELVPQDPNDEPALVLLDRIRAVKARITLEERPKVKGKGKMMKRKVGKPNLIPTVSRHPGSNEKRSAPRTGRNPSPPGPNA